MRESALASGVPSGHWEPRDRVKSQTTPNRNSTPTSNQKPQQTAPTHKDTRNGQWPAWIPSTRSQRHRCSTPPSSRRPNGTPLACHSGHGFEMRESALASGVPSGHWEPRDRVKSQTTPNRNSTPTSNQKPQQTAPTHKDTRNGQWPAWIPSTRSQRHRCSAPPSSRRPNGTPLACHSGHGFEMRESALASGVPSGHWEPRDRVKSQTTPNRNSTPTSNQKPQQTAPTHKDTRNGQWPAWIPSTRSQRHRCSAPPSSRRPNGTPLACHSGHGFEMRESALASGVPSGHWEPRDRVKSQTTPNRNSTPTSNQKPQQTAPTHKDTRNGQWPAWIPSTRSQRHRCSAPPSSRRPNGTPLAEKNSKELQFFRARMTNSPRNVVRRVDFWPRMPTFWPKSSTRKEQMGALFLSAEVSS